MTLEELDNLAMERLDLLEQLLKKKMVLSEYLKQGYFHLGKARYALGGHAVSILRIPGEAQALVRTTSTQEPLSSDAGEQHYTARRLLQHEPIIANTPKHSLDAGRRTNASDGGDEDDQNSGNVRLRTNAGKDTSADGEAETNITEQFNKKCSVSCTDDSVAKESTAIEDLDIKKLSGEFGKECSDVSDDEEEKPLPAISRRPMNWFSALPPQSLRQAHSSFVSCTSLAAEVSSLSDRLCKLDAHYTATLAASRQQQSAL